MLVKLFFPFIFGRMFLLYPSGFNSRIPVRSKFCFGANVRYVRISNFFCLGLKFFLQCAAALDRKASKATKEAFQR